MSSWPARGENGRVPSGVHSQPFSQLDLRPGASSSRLGMNVSKTLTSLMHMPARETSR